VLSHQPYPRLNSRHYICGYGRIKFTCLDDGSPVPGWVWTSGQRVRNLTHQAACCERKEFGYLVAMWVEYCCRCTAVRPGMARSTKKPAGDWRWDVEVYCLTIIRALGWYGAPCRRTFAADESREVGRGLRPGGKRILPCTEPAHSYQRRRSWQRLLPRGCNSSRSGY